MKCLGGIIGKSSEVDYFSEKTLWPIAKIKNTKGNIKFPPNESNVLHLGEVSFPV